MAKCYHTLIPAALLMFVLLFSGTTCASGETLNTTRITSLSEITPLSGDWKIDLEDNKLYCRPHYNDTAWDTVSLPGNLMPTVYQKGGGSRGILWLRKTILIDRDLPIEDIGLIMGRIAHADEVYFNGTKVGGMGELPPGDYSMWNHPRHYQIPHSLIRLGGPNVIAVRIYYNIYGEIVGTMGIANMHEWERNRILSNFFIIILPYIFIAMGIPIFLIFIFLMIKRHDSREYVYYCLQLICVSLIILDGCNYWDTYGGLLNRFKVLSLAWAGIIVLHHRFLNRIYNIKRQGTERAFWLYFFIVLGYIILFMNESNVQFMGMLFIAMTLAFGLYNLGLNIGMFLKKRSCFHFFTFFEIIAILGAIHDGVIYFSRFAGIRLNGAFWHFMLFHYTAALLFLGIAMVLVIRFIRVVGEMRNMALDLESFIVENALLNQRLNESDSRRRLVSANINDRTEEKIEQVIQYIRENYTDDISREGLAAMVDIHPDNLGRFFKVYTNRRIGDYINELRVEYASKKLAETDCNIITIAFDVGFDSLRTFNRVFRKIMGITPEKFRKNAINSVILAPPSLETAVE